MNSLPLNENDTDKLGFTCWKAITHRIHIWHMYLHLVDFFDGRCIGKCTIPGSYMVRL